MATEPFRKVNNVPAQLSIDGLIDELMTLATISEAEPPVVTRVVFSAADLRARADVKGLCAEAGCNWQYVCTLGGNCAGACTGGNGLAHRCDSECRTL
jgi:hypothetical protein